MAIRIALITSLALLTAVCVVLSGAPLGTSSSTTFKDGTTLTVTIYRSMSQHCDTNSHMPCAAVDWRKLYADMQGEKAKHESPFDLIGGR